VEFYPQICLGTYLWDTSTSYIDKKNICSKREGKIDKGPNQLVQQAMIKFTDHVTFMSIDNEDHSIR
jgi:hypothetical protein